jgi:hypothetical protein
MTVTGTDSPFSLKIRVIPNFFPMIPFMPIHLLLKTASTGAPPG